MRNILIIMFLLSCIRLSSNAKEDGDNSNRRYWNKQQYKPNEVYKQNRQQTKYDGQPNLQYGNYRKSPNDFDTFVNGYDGKQTNSHSDENDYYNEEDYNEKEQGESRNNNYLLDQYPEIYRINLEQNNRKRIESAKQITTPKPILKKTVPFTETVVYRTMKTTTKSTVQKSKRNNTRASQIFSEHTPYSNKAIIRQKSKPNEPTILPVLSTTRKFVKNNSVEGYRTNIYRSIINNRPSTVQAQDELEESDEVDEEEQINSLDTPTISIETSQQNDDSDNEILPSSTTLLPPTTPFSTTTSPTTPNNVAQRRTFSFSYDDRKDNGPSNWLFINTQCADILQSPVPLTDKGVSKGEYKEKLRINGLSNLPDSMSAENDGHSAKFSMQYSKGKVPQLQGGPLDIPYNFDQFHFHWGSTNSYGSEHTMNGIRYPMEIHLLFYNSIYNSLAEARDRPKGLAVIALFYDITTEMDHRTNPFTKFLIEIITPTMNYTMLDNERFSLKEVLGGTLDWNFISYRGSLTTPPCSQTVIWIVSLRTLRITEKELTEFRKLRTQDGSMSDNFRPLQDLNGRVQFLNLNKEGT